MNITVNKKNSRYTVIVDRSALDVIDGRKLYILTSKKNNNIYTNYAYIFVDCKMTMLHRLLTNAKKGFDVDHINNNGLDNRLSNLRVCTRSQNKANSRKYKNNKSGYRGVSWDKSKNKWRAQIGIRGKNYRLGRFNDPLEAYSVYKKAAYKAFGTFAHLD